ncbi:MAG TPA: ferritin-like domain-containing protein [Rubricoccaceae bacterium]|jgi:hypothetical protein
MESNLLSVLEHGTETVESRRNALALVGRLSAGAILSMLPFAAAEEARAQAAGADDVDILNFALTLEFLDGLFYAQGLATPGLIPESDRPLWTRIVANETGHRAALTATITALVGAIEDDTRTPVVFDVDDFNYSALGFDPFSSYELFTLLSQGFEDLGQRAYKGQAPFLTSDAVLTAALNIHSVEARHAAAIRKIRGLQGWIPADGTDVGDAPIRMIYQGGQTRNGVTDPSPSDDNVTQGGVTISATDRYTLVQIQEAFDEPLEAATVKNIADPFVIPPLD